MRLVPDEEIIAQRRSVMYFARRYARMGVSLEDLEAEGMLALAYAASKFDQSKGTKFSTYSNFWIQAHLKRYVEGALHAVCRPSNLRTWRLIDKELKPTTKALVASLGRAPTDTELAEALGVPLEDVQGAKAWNSHRDGTISADAGEGHWPTDDGTLPDELVDGARQRARLKAAVASALDALPVRERSVIVNRVYADEPKTLEAIGRELGVSRSRIQQLEAKAMARLRASLEAFAPSQDDGTEATP